MLLRATSMCRLVVLGFLFSVLGLAQAQGEKAGGKPATFNAQELAKEYRTDPDAFDRKHLSREQRPRGVLAAGAVTPSRPWFPPRGG